MRVALVTRAYWPSIGGVERVAEQLSRALRDAGHDVDVIAQRVDDGPHTKYMHVLREAPAFEAGEHDGARVRQLRLSPARRAMNVPAAALMLPLVARAGRGPSARAYALATRGAVEPLIAGADAVHVLGGELLAAATVEACRRAGRPVVVSPFAHPGEWGDDPGSAWAYRRADAVIATLEPDAALYRSMGVPAERVHVAGLPVAAAPAAPGTSREDDLVLFLGARRPNKGVDVLQAAAPLVWERAPDTRFAFVGPGQPLALRDERVLDVGAVDDAARGEWLARAAVLCLPSSSETFGLAVAEAWSAGTPVVVSDIPALRELVQGSGGGLVAERAPRAIAAALTDTLADAAAARDMGEAGRARWSERFRPEAVARRLLEIYAGAGAR